MPRRGAAVREPGPTLRHPGEGRDPGYLTSEPATLGSGLRRNDENSPPSGPPRNENSLPSGLRRNDENSRADTIEVRRLGLIPYSEALELQSDLVRGRRAGEISDTLLLLQHPHVITMGTGSHPENLLLSDEERLLLGIELFPAGRGGDITYHGPGQLVGYPILDLKPDRCDLHRYLRDLEDVLIGVLGDFGIAGSRREGMTGAWAGDRKLAAIGVRVSSGWITSHGFALNVSTDLRFFDSIVPCGIRDYGVGSLSSEAGRAISMEEAEASVVRQWVRVFG